MQCVYSTVQYRTDCIIKCSVYTVQYSTVPYRLHPQVQCVYSTVQYRTDCIVKCSVYSTVQYSTVQAASSSAVCIQYSVVPYRLHLTDLTSNVRWINSWFNGLCIFYILFQNNVTFGKSFHQNKLFYEYACIISTVDEKKNYIENHIFLYFFVAWQCAVWNRWVPCSNCWIVRVLIRE